MESLKQLLEESKLVELVEQQDIIVLEHNQSVADALKVRQTEILSTWTGGFARISSINFR